MARLSLTETQDEISKAIEEHRYDDAASLAKFILHQYESSSFSKSEIDRTIDSAYKNTANFGTKYYEDDSAVTQVKDMVRKGYTRKEVRKEFQKKKCRP